MSHEEIRVLHLITRLIVGGAQENTLLTADFLLHNPDYAGRYHVDIASGPQTGPEGQLHGEVRGRNIPLTIIPELVREISPWKDLIALGKLVRLLRSGRYTILHTHSSKAGVLGRLAAKLAGTPIVVHTVHGWSFHEHMPAMLRILFIALERWLAHASQKLIVVSSTDREKGLRAGIGSPEQYVLIRSGISLERFSHPRLSRQAMRRQLGLSASGPVVGTVTRLSPQKAPLDLIRAFARVAAVVPDVELLVVGDGPLRPQVEALIHQLRLAERVHLLGLRRDVPEIMGCLDLFVLTSLWEGLPKVIPQAMASGIAVVATGVNGSREIVQQGINGYLCPPGQPERIAQRCIALLTRPALLRAMGYAGTQSVAAFSLKQMVADIENLYRRLVAIYVSPRHVSPGYQPHHDLKHMQQQDR